MTKKHPSILSKLKNAFVAGERWAKEHKPFGTLAKWGGGALPYVGGGISALASAGYGKKRKRVAKKK